MSTELSTIILSSERSVRLTHGLSGVATLESLELFQNDPFLFADAWVDDPYVGLEFDFDGAMDLLLTMRSYNGLSVGRQPQIMIR